MAEPKEPLTERELQIVQLLATGVGNKEIAAQLFLSPNTVKVHLRNIFTKLEVQTRTEATLIAVRNGWVIVPKSETKELRIENVEREHPAASSTLEIEPEHRSRLTQIEEDHAPPSTLHAPLSNNSNNSFPITPVLVAPNPQLLLPLSMRRRIAIVATLVIALALSVLSLNIRPTDAISGQNPETAPGEPIVPLLSQPTNWNARTTIKTARARSMAVGTQGQVVVIGGEVDRKILDEVLVYEPAKNQWRDLEAPKPTPVLNTAAVALGENVYVPGGLTANNAATDRFEVLNVISKTWLALPRLPKAISNHAVAVLPNQVFVLGGRSGGQTTNEAYVFDVTANRWSSLPPMPTVREGAAAVGVNGRVFVLGGFDGRRELATCEYFAAAENAWHSCKPMTIGRSSFGLANIGGALYAVGGGAINFIGWNEKYDIATDTWTTFDTPAAHSGDWRQIAVASLPTAFFVIGGKTRNVPLSDNYVYEVLGNRTFLPSLNTGDK